MPGGDKCHEKNKAGEETREYPGRKGEILNRIVSEGFNLNIIENSK